MRILNRRVWMLLVPIAVGILFLVSGLLKANDPAPLAGVLIFDGIPKEAAGFFAMCVIAFELIVGSLILARVAPELMAKVATVSLIVFSVQLCVLMMFQDAPDCGCLGGMKFFADSRSEATWGLVRNSVLLLGLFFYRRSETKSFADDERAPTKESNLIGVKI